MTSQTPPYPYFNGITYNPSFFTTSSSSGGTVAGSLNYPTAQGVEVFPYGLTSVGLNNAGTLTTGVLSSGLISSTNNIQAVGSITGASFGNTAGTAGIDTTGAITGISLDSTAPTSTFNFLASQKSGFNLGTGISSGQTVQIGPLGSTAGVSVRCANIDFTNNSINNATSAGSGDLNIANNQISGTLNFGTQAFRTGNINIGTGGLGGTISIGATGSGLNNLVCKGSTGSSISITGPISCSQLTSTGGITGTSLDVGTGTITSGSITSSGFIKGTGFTGTSLNVGTGTIISGAITSSGAITGTGFTGTSLNVGTGTIISGAITSSGAITGTGITGTSLSLGTGAISTVGNITSTGDIQATSGKVKAGTLDAVTDTAAGTTALNIGSNVVAGNIVIGNSQTTGDIIIGASDASGATITVGTSFTATTINGSLTANNGLTVISGQTLKANTIDTTATTSSMTIGGTIATTNDISLGTNCLIKLKSPSIANTGAILTTQAAATITLFGNLMYAMADSGAGPTNYQIPANINRDYYLRGSGSVAFTVYFPPVVIHQIIHVRCFNTAFMNIQIHSTNPTARIYPAVSGGGAFTTYAVQPNVALTFYCDGTHWYGI